MFRIAAGVFLSQLACMQWVVLFAAEAEGGADKGKVEVRLPEVRTSQLQVLPYFTVEGEKRESSLFKADREANDRLEVAPGLKVDQAAGTNAKWTWDLSSHFTPDATQTDLVRSRDCSRLAYRFDDGLFWTNLERSVELDYDLDPKGSDRSQQTAYRWGAGHRLHSIDWGMSLARQEKETFADDESATLREQWDKRVWMKLKATDYFRPMVALQRRDVIRPDDGDPLARADADGRLLSLSADGGWAETLRWRGSWQCEFIDDKAWAARSPGDGSVGERSALSTGLSWRPAASAPRLDLSFTKESGYETEQQYREKNQWALSASQQLTRAWGAQATAGILDESELGSHELRRWTAGVSSTYKLSSRAQLSGEYRYRQEEEDAVGIDTQFRVQLKMKW